MTRLDGWKDIAGYLNRTVRTVQRWERESGLPIRRLGPRRSESVFAFTAELDVWLETPRGRRVSSGQRPEAPTVPVPQDLPVEVPRPRRWTRWALAAGVIAAAAVAAAMLTSHLPRAGCAGAPTGWRMEGRVFVAFDGEGTRCWTHTFSGQSIPSAESRVTVLGGTVDFDGDGRREFWVVPFGGRDADPALSLFDEGGTLRWSYKFRGQVSFGRQSFAGPWQMNTALVTADPDTPSRSALWAVACHPDRSLSVLVRLDPQTGRVIGGPYWHAGLMQAAILYHDATGVRLAVGATSSDYRLPTLLILNPRALDGASPAGDPRYRCTTCGPDTAWAVLVFPTPPRLEAVAGAGRVNNVGFGGDQVTLAISVDYVGGDRRTRVPVTFMLDRDLRVAATIVGEEFRNSYAVLVRDRRIPDRGPLPDDVTAEVPLPRRLNGRDRSVSHHVR